MKILFAASECVPFVKIGGLADVVGGLPKALKKLGLEVAVVIPWYREIKTGGVRIGPETGKMKVEYGGQEEEVFIRQSLLPGSDVTVYFLENSKYLTNGGIYTNQELHPAEEIERFVFFSQAVSTLVDLLGAQDLKELGFGKSDVVHCHDWHTSLVPLLLKSTLNFDKKPRTILTIHNLGRAYQGVAETSVVTKTVVKINNLTRIAGEEKINILLQGIMQADYVTTVSPTYAREIRTAQYGEGLETYLQKKKHLYGIINGIDDQIWNPAEDRHLPYEFTNERNFFESKKLNKDRLYEQLGITKGPDDVLLGMVTRIAEQKGFDILLPVLRDLLEDKRAKIVILGVGDAGYEEELEKLSGANNNFVFLKRFDEYFAHLIYAASDIFLMPSRFEPCGIGQLVAMAYGSLPLVRKVGGLADSVEDLKTGFVFTEYTKKALSEKINQSLTLYRNQPETFLKMQENARKLDFSWNKSAREYLKLYQQLFVYN